MKAIRYHQLGGPEVLRLEEVPEPVAGPGEVRIRVGAAGVRSATVPPVVADRGPKNALRAPQRGGGRMPGRKQG